MRDVDEHGHLVQVVRGFRGVQARSSEWSSRILGHVGRKNYLVEGLSGTGKTSVCDELQRRGYHAEDCDHLISYTEDQSFSNLPDEIHLARNDGTEPVVIYASYYLPLTIPGTLLRTNQPSPGADCRL